MSEEVSEVAKELLGKGEHGACVLEPCVPELNKQGDLHQEQQQ